jgi:hypothetical protein
MELISAFEKKLTNAHVTQASLEARISHLDSVNKKLTLRNANLTQKNSELQSSLESSIPKAEHQKVIDELTTSITDKITAISDLTERLALVENARLAKQCEVADALNQNRALIQSIAEKDTELCRVRTEFDSLILRISVLRDEANTQAASHHHQIESIESHHSLAIQMLEKSHATQAQKLQSELDLTAKLVKLKDSQLNQVQARLMDFETQLTQQKTRDICIDMGVQSVTDVVVASSQTEALVNRTVATEPDEKDCEDFCSLSKAEVEVLRKHLGCSSCSGKDAYPVSTLFPCGHGLCSECVAIAMQSDMNRIGISCKECGNNLPVTRISLNYPMIALSDYLVSILPPRDCYSG